MTNPQHQHPRGAGTVARGGITRSGFVPPTDHTRGPSHDHLANAPNPNAHPSAPVANEGGYTPRGRGFHRGGGGFNSGLGYRGRGGFGPSMNERGRGGRGGGFRGRGRGYVPAPPLPS